MESKIVLITGATDGIGLAAALRLAQMGARVVGVGRNPEKAARAADFVRQQVGVEVDFLIANLSSIQQTRHLAEEFRQRFSRLDVLLNNAGALFDRRQVSVDGLEMTFALNHMSYFVLALELLDLLRAGPPARVINVSSEMHRGARLDFADLQSTHHYSAWDAYAKSKLANVLFTYELARRLQGTQVTANALSPGYVATSFGRSDRRPIRIGPWEAPKPGARSPEKGALTSVYLAASPDVEGLSGRYFADEHELPSSTESHDEGAARRLWEVSWRLTAGG